MTHRVFRTVRRGHVFDELIETLLGTTVTLLWFAMPVVGALLPVLVLSSLGADALAWLVAFLAFWVFFLAPTPFFTRVERWIADKVLQPGINRGKLVIGDDGVRLTGLFLERFAPFGEVERVRVEEEERRVVVELSRGRPLRFRVADIEEVARVLSAAAHAYHDSISTTPVRAFRDARRDLEKWLERAKTAAGDGGYRQEVLSPDILVGIAEDASADPEQRVGAALALSDAPEPFRVRVRVAAEKIARPGLGEAVSRAVAGDLGVEGLTNVLTP